jgi:hypothetical protein
MTFCSVFLELLYADNGHTVKLKGKLLKLLVLKAPKINIHMRYQIENTPLQRTPNICN